MQVIQRLLLGLTRGSAWVGMTALMGAMVATCADVAARKLLGYTYPGTIDVVQLLVLTAAFLSIPYTFMRRGHVAVAIVADYLSERAMEILNSMAALLSAMLMGSFTWFAYRHALLQMEYGDVSQTIGIPMGWYWAPLILGCALSVVTALWLMVDAAARARAPNGPNAGRVG
jgi:TRAP-type C4-dicarboxylate transport system permease small subunit